MIDTFDKIGPAVRTTKLFSIECAASILNNQSPSIFRANLAEVKRTHIMEMESAIAEAIRGEELEAYDLCIEDISGPPLYLQKQGRPIDEEISFSDLSLINPRRTTIETAELVRWCESKGLPHPFTLKPPTKKEITAHHLEQVGTPKVGTVLSDDPEVRARQLEQENAEQKKQIESLKQQLEEQKQEQRTEFQCMTHELELVAKLQRRFLKNIDYQDPDTYPKLKHCLDYLKEQDSDLSDRAARAIDRVAMPFKR